mmetsp:Transcript_121978/g.390250  ORF Transcript_121978/g.390250 Transcript_121978/m.390250 type:complete len:233 (+) Transcript_121978:1269-1967(+)
MAGASRTPAWSNSKRLDAGASVPGALCAPGYTARTARARSRPPTCPEGAAFESTRRRDCPRRRRARRHRPPLRLRLRCRRIRFRPLAKGLSHMRMPAATPRGRRMTTRCRTTQGALDRYPFLGCRNGCPAEVSMDDVAKHNTKEDCWVVFYGTAYDLTKFGRVHPGGANLVFDNAGGRARRRGHRRRQACALLLGVLRREGHRPNGAHAAGTWQTMSCRIPATTSPLARTCR